MAQVPVCVITYSVLKVAMSWQLSACHQTCKRAVMDRGFISPFSRRLHCFVTFPMSWFEKSMEPDCQGWANKKETWKTLMSTWLANNYLLDRSELCRNKVQMSTWLANNYLLDRSELCRNKVQMLLSKPKIFQFLCTVSGCNLTWFSYP